MTKIKNIVSQRNRLLVAFDTIILSLEDNPNENSIKYTLDVINAWHREVLERGLVAKLGTKVKSFDDPKYIDDPSYDKEHICSLELRRDNYDIPDKTVNS